MELVSRCQQGDTLAWEGLVRRFQSRIYGLAYQYVREDGEARDLAQEIFIQLYRQLHRFQGDQFLPWMLRLARNRCVDYLRRRQARPPTDDVQVDEGLELVADDVGPEAESMLDERRQLVQRAMERLGDQNREILILKEMQGLNFREIAQLLNVPVGTVKSRSHRARLELAGHILALDPSYGSVGS